MRDALYVIPTAALIAVAAAVVLRPAFDPVPVVRGPAPPPIAGVVAPPTPAALAAEAASLPSPGTGNQARPPAPLPVSLPFPAPAPRPGWEATLATADAARGLRIMQGGLGSGVQPCTSCHGVNGDPVAGVEIPRLSGQSAYYLAKQLNDYADETRRNVMMTQYARLLTPQQRADVSLAWSQRRAPHATPQLPAELVARGGTLAQAGDNERGLPACANCHGIAGQGLGRAIPYIAGQNLDYGLAALQEWAQGRRANDSGAVMRYVVQQLAPEDRRAVAAYYASLPPPGVQ